MSDIEREGKREVREREKNGDIYKLSPEQTRMYMSNKLVSTYGPLWTKKLGGFFKNAIIFLSNDTPYLPSLSLPLSSI